MKDLKGYSGFLFNNRLEELAGENLCLLKKHNLLSMKFFSHLSEEELYDLSKSSVAKFVNSLLGGSSFADAKRGLKQWENNEISGIPRGDIRPSDLMLAYTIQKKGLLKFLPDYTTDVNEVLNIVKELEDYLVEAQNDAVVTLFKIQQQAIENLRMSEERYHLLVNEVVDYAIIRLDLNGNVTTWNKGAEKIKGYTAAEIIGENISVFYPEEEIRNKKPQNNLENARVYGRHEKEGYRLTKDGSKFWANIIYTALYDADGKLTGYVKVVRDFSGRKHRDEKIAKTMRQLSEAQQIAHIGGWEWDIKTNLVSWSDELCRIYGLQPNQNEHNYESYLGYMHPEDRVRVNKIFKSAIHDKKPFQFDHRIFNQKGEERVLSSHGIITADEEGKAILMSGTEQDISERLHAMDELKRAEDTVKSKQQFLSNMSHEIRTPMNAIIGFTKVVLKTDLNPKQKEYLDAIKVSGETLLVLINDILDLAKVDEGKMVFECIPFKLSSSFSTMIHLFETRMQEKNLNMGKLYDPNIPKILLGDPVRLHQIILNLLSNAIKFTKKGHIIVSVRLFHEEASEVTIEFSISDSGIGIPPEHLRAIFDNFHQASSSTARIYGGTGLGLAIVKQLVEKQGGSINIKSQVGKGSTITFYLTFKKATEETAMKVAELEHLEFEKELTIKNIKVLVVEDIPLNQLLMKTLLNDFGCEYEIAENGKIAIQKMREKDYDIVLMDLQMPVMNGFEATEFIRTKLESQTPIIALTADVTTVDLEKCKAVGMNDYIAKPIDERILFNKIVKALKISNNSKLSFEREEVNEPMRSDTVTNKVTCLDYLYARTKKNPILMQEMLQLFLLQTPILVHNMEVAALASEWETISASAHKLVPSFSIVGISKEYETMAKMIQDYADKKTGIETIRELAAKIGNICMRACEELDEEMKYIEMNTEVKS
jgi:PAS domain S-box-containing protein